MFPANTVLRLFRNLPVERVDRKWDIYIYIYRSSYLTACTVCIMCVYDKAYMPIRAWWSIYKDPQYTKREWCGECYNNDTYRRGLFLLFIDRAMTKIEKFIRAQRRSVAQVICTLRWLFRCTKPCRYRLQGHGDLQ